MVEYLTRIATTQGKRLIPNTYTRNKTTTIKMFNMKLRNMRIHMMGQT